MLGLKKSREATVKLAAFFFFFAATLFHLIPLSLHPTDSVNEPIDSLLNTWIISWTHLNLAKNPASIYDANIFYPNRGSLSFSEHLFPLAGLSWPVFLVARNPILSHQFLLFLFVTLNGYTMFLLLKHLTGNSWAGLVGGFMFAFNSFQIQHISHLQLQSSWLIPLAFLYLHKFLAGRRLKHALLFAGLCFGQAWCCIYYGLFLVSILILILPLFLLAYYKSLNFSFLLRLFIPLLFVGLLMLVLSQPYFSLLRNFDFKRILAPGTDVIHYLAPYNENRVLGRFLSPLGKYEFFLFPGILLSAFAGISVLSTGRLFRDTPKSLRAILGALIGLSFLAVGIGLLTNGLDLKLAPLRFSVHNIAKPGFLFFAGLAVLFLAGFVFNVLRNRQPREDDRTAFIYILCFFWAFFLSFGGHFSFLGHSTSALPLPFRWFYNSFPGFKGIRVPSRYAVFVMFSLVILAGYGFKFVLSKIRRKTVARALLASALLFLNVEYLTLPQQCLSLPTAGDIPPTYKWLRQQPGDFAIVELPFHQGIGFDAVYMYFSLFHRKMIINGYSGFIPPSTMYIRQVFDVFPSVASVDVLRSLGVRYVVFHKGIGRPGKNERSARVIQEKFGDALKPVAQFHYRLKEQNEATAGLGDDIVYEVIPAPPEEKPTTGLEEIPASEWSVQSNSNREELPHLRDGRMDTAWSTGRPQAAGDFLLVEFKKPEKATRVALQLKDFSPDQAIDLDVEVAEDGQNWKILAGGYSAGEFAWNLVRRPRRPVQNLYLEGNPIRFLRIVNLRDDPYSPWSAAEMRIYRISPN